MSISAPPPPDASTHCNAIRGAYFERSRSVYGFEPFRRFSVDNFLEIPAAFEAPDFLANNFADDNFF